jgi:glycosyltransferase involved in cell wall biosynthesis
LNKLAIISTHPIQYNAPFFKLLTHRAKVTVKVFYTWSQSQSGSKYDPGFGKNIEWDIPLLDGYKYSFVNNISSSPGSHHYKGIVNPTLIDEINEWGANAVLVYGWSFKSHFKAMRYFKGKIPVFFRGDSTLLDEQSGIRKIIRNFFLRFVYRYVDYAMYAGKANKNYFLENGLKENQLVFMPHAIDNNRFALSEEKINAATQLRNKLQIAEDAIVFLFAGKLEPKKQPHFLAKIFNQLPIKNIHLIIAGNGILEDQLKKDFAHAPNIHFLDFQNQQSMPALYAACNVFILASKGPGETWGLAVNEAMAAGKPVIVSNACGVAYDLVYEAETGFVFEKSNEQELKKCITYFSENKGLLKNMGNNCTERISKYSFKEQVDAIESVVLKKAKQN